MKKINFAKLFNRLRDRFMLTDYGPPELPLLQETVVPITNFDELAKVTKRGPYQASSTLDISAAASWLVVGTVPNGKRWTLKMLYREATTANSRLQIADEGGYAYNLSDNGTAAENYRELDLVMAQGWTIQIRTTGNGGDNARAVQWLYYEEDAF